MRLIRDVRHDDAFVLLLLPVITPGLPGESRLARMIEYFEQNDFAPWTALQDISSVIRTMGSADTLRKKHHRHDAFKAFLQTFHRLFSHFLIFLDNLIAYLAGFFNR